MWIVIAGVYINCSMMNAVHEHLLEDLGNNTAKSHNCDQISVVLVLQNRFGLVLVLVLDFKSSFI